MKTVLFTCGRSAGPALMAAAFFNEMADPEAAHAIPAGNVPSPEPAPDLRAAMAELGLEGTLGILRPLTVRLAAGAWWAVTLHGSADAAGSLPLLLGVHRTDWPVEEGEGPEELRALRDELRERVRLFLSTEGWLREDAASRR